MIIGDMKARFGKAVRNVLPLHVLPDMNNSYSVVEDDMSLGNNNA